MVTERGMVLLEVLVALAVLASAGAAIVVLGAEVLALEHGAAERDRLLRIEERVLTAHVLLTREDLDRRLGRRTLGEIVVEIQRPAPTLYRVAVGPLETRAEDLVTVVFRAEARPVDAP